ncbi:MAG: hypothetical protein M1817_005152 [Caeruleum heppii]|nr:MAG: hypothetical protein M1817_005152 [Caeruleum heppii]
MSILRQTWALTSKTLLIAGGRHALSTTLRAFFLPVIFAVFMAFARYLFIPPSHFGIAPAMPVRSMQSAFLDGTATRDKVIFVNNGLRGGDIDRVIQDVAEPIRAAGKTVEVLERDGQLIEACQSSLRGVSNCFAGAVFWSSPTEGPAPEGDRERMWNYTLRADGALGRVVDIRKDTNDPQIYTIPLQHAIDSSIASVGRTQGANATALQEVFEYPYTQRTEEERQERIRTRYMGGIIQVIAVVFFLELVGIVYQLVGFQASEREQGMSQLIEAMMPNTRRVHAQMARLVSYHLAYDIIYAPGWIVVGVVLGGGLFTQTGVGINLVFAILAGLALSSWAIFGATFFKRAQLSGITVTIVSVLLAILAQVISTSGTGTIAILGLLFPPMNFVFFIIFMARYERQNLGTNLINPAPENPWEVPGIALWVFFIIQIIVYPILGALVERSLYGTASKSRTVSKDKMSSANAVTLTNFSKHYRPNFFARRVASLFTKPKPSVVAVNDLTLTAKQGQILVLLGANGSGKTTTLEAVAGLNSITSGAINVDGQGGLGICPQKNVLWPDLTCEEHVKIFSRLKKTDGKDSKQEIRRLLTSCDLEHKIRARSKTLSGGQKRKLQLAMMFTGGSRVCCTDEVSSGLDPLSRRKIWDILLAERGARTFILTTHFLDEADLLADHIAMLSKGTLKAEGSAVELKHRLGGGYRVHLQMHPGAAYPPSIEGVSPKLQRDAAVYTVPTSADAARLIARMEASGMHDYQVSGPTIEDVFLKVADEVNATHAVELLKVKSRTEQATIMKPVGSDDRSSDDVDVTEKGLDLRSGKRMSIFKQTLVLFRKRLTIVRRNYLPYCAALLIPIVAAGLVTLFLKDYEASGCDPSTGFEPQEVASLLSDLDFQLVIGPSSKLSPELVSRFTSSLPGGGSGLEGGGLDTAALLEAVQPVETLQEFNDYISRNFANVTPGGFFLGDDSSPPTFAYRDNIAIYNSVIIQNALDSLSTNVSIATQFSSFDVPWPADVGKSLQLVTYFGLSMAAYPAFFALYPTVERLRQVRALHYSNGVRSFPLWMAYAMFDFCIVIVASVIAIIIFATATDVWYHVGYLFVVFLLYGLASTLLSYVISLFAKSQLSAYAIAAGGQCVMFLLYFIAYMCVQTYAPYQDVDRLIDVVHFAIATITPSGNLVRALFVALNIFSISCRDRELISYPGDIVAYGGPILYLILQSFALFGILLWFDSGKGLNMFSKRGKSIDEEQRDTQEKEISNELQRVSSSNDGLRVLHATKAFKKNVAVQDVTFGVPRGEVFALLGPNGAGKSTIISLIRGDIPLPRDGGEIFVENISVRERRAAARAHLGVCPQFDATDTMTVLEHLRFYAAIRGVQDVEHNVSEVVRAVGLQDFTSRMAGKLSGGNKRKLSLGIALMGNPTVLLLDEPSSGMDAAAKRVMWKTLAAVVPGRSLVLTTHSMEEADALADRAGIMAKRMLALGTSESLRRKHGDQYYVHLITKSAPHTTTEEMMLLRDWIANQFAGADIEEKTFHGQVRFNVPARTGRDGMSSDERKEGGGISDLFRVLEQNKDGLGLEYYSVSRTTLDQVFLTIVGKHQVEEENSGVEKRRRKGFFGWGRR